MSKVGIRIFSDGSTATIGSGPIHVMVASALIRCIAFAFGIETVVIGADLGKDGALLTISGKSIVENNRCHGPLDVGFDFRGVDANPHS